MFMEDVISYNSCWLENTGKHWIKVLLPKFLQGDEGGISQ